MMHNIMNHTASKSGLCWAQEHRNCMYVNILPMAETPLMSQTKMIRWAAFWRANSVKTVPNQICNPDSFGKQLKEDSWAKMLDEPKMFANLNTSTCKRWLSTDFLLWFLLFYRLLWVYLHLHWKMWQLCLSIKENWLVNKPLISHFIIRWVAVA